MNDKILKQLVKSTNIITDMIDTCDHSVDICFCDIWQTLYNNKKVIEEVTGKDWRLSGIEENTIVTRQ